MCDSGRQWGGARERVGAGTACSDPEDLIGCLPPGTFSTQSLSSSPHPPQSLNYLAVLHLLSS